MKALALYPSGIMVSTGVNNLAWPWIGILVEGVPASIRCGSIQVPVLSWLFLLSAVAATLPFYRASKL